MKEEVSAHKKRLPSVRDVVKERVVAAAAAAAATVEADAGRTQAGSALGSRAAAFQPGGDGAPEHSGAGDGGEEEGWHHGG